MSSQSRPTKWETRLVILTIVIVFAFGNLSHLPRLPWHWDHVPTRPALPQQHFNVDSVPANPAAPYGGFPVSDGCKAKDNHTVVRK